MPPPKCICWSPGPRHLRRGLVATDVGRSPGQALVQGDCPCERGLWRQTCMRLVQVEADAPSAHHGGCVRGGGQRPPSACGSSQPASPRLAVSRTAREPISVGDVLSVGVVGRPSKNATSPPRATPLLPCLASGHRARSPGPSEVTLPRLPRPSSPPAAPWPPSESRQCGRGPARWDGGHEARRCGLAWPPQPRALGLPGSGPAVPPVAKPFQVAPGGLSSWSRRSPVWGHPASA